MNQIHSKILTEEISLVYWLFKTIVESKISYTVTAIQHNPNKSSAVAWLIKQAIEKA